MVAKLFDSIQPEHYTIELFPNLEEARFELNESVIFANLAANSEFVFHAVGLDVLAATIDGQAVARIENDGNEVRFVTSEDLTVGRHTLQLNARGKIQDSLHGFYLSTYHIKGVPHRLATTQFEAIHAREAIVCIDEPAAKATFDVRLNIPSSLQGLSNAKCQSEEIKDNIKRLVFETTPRMSTYLLAFIIGEFESVGGEDKNGTRVQVLATPGQQKALNFALDIAIRSLDFYTQYFAQRYPLPKLDMVAIPDFASGAMENWGLVTYRETDLLIDPVNSSMANRQRVTEVIAHELAHQWFGNLVTMAWWNDLWLNESFASWVETLAADKFFPEWRYWSVFSSTLGSYALELDSLVNSHPIEVEVTDPAALDEIFDGISYWKGAYIIRMLEEYLGPEIFRSGLRQYLRQYAFGSAVTGDLWNALAESSDQPVANVMKSWTQRTGYPLITVRRDNDQLMFTQERFFGSPEQRRLVEATDIWSVPLVINTPAGTQKLLYETRTMATSGPESNWVKVNPNKTGFYRVRYDDGLKAALTLALADPQQPLPPDDRFDLVSDYFGLAQAGYVSATEALELIVPLQDETEYNVWQAILAGLSALRNVLEIDEKELLDSFSRSMLMPIYHRLGWEARPKEDSFTTMLRPIIIGNAGACGDNEVIAEAFKRFSARSKAAISVDLEGAVFAIVGRYGSTTDYDELTKLLQTTTQPQAKQRVRQALTRPHSVELLERTLRLSLASEVRPQDTIGVIGGVFVNPYGRELAWNFIKDNWSILFERYGEGGKMLEFLPDYAGRAFNRRGHAKMVEEFFLVDNPMPSLLRPAKQASETIRLNHDYYERDGQKVLDWIKSRQ